MYSPVLHEGSFCYVYFSGNKGISFLIMIKLITRHSWKAGTLLLFLTLLLLDSLVVD